jgi:hypothetical protein
MYKPNFCAECGARIERARWRLWTSRKFCTDCAPRLVRAQVLLTFVVWFTLFGIGLLMGRAMRQAPPPLVVERGSLPLAPEVASAPKQTEPEETETSANSNASREQSYGPSGTQTERPTDPAEVVSICGARTQKGTPCQRRVRGTGRCWQHRGMNAILPPPKLIIPN